MNYLVVIPARGGSKGIPNKNIKLLLGKPLIYYTIDAAKSLFQNQDICVSTDDIEIKNMVERTGLKVPFLRPSELATDTIGIHEVLIHAIEYYESKDKVYDAVVLLQPTSPMRQAKHITEALKLFSLALDMVVSVNKTKSNPYFNLFEEGENGFLKRSKESNFIRRQDCPTVWEYNGAIYVINISSMKRDRIHSFQRIKKYVMDNKYSHDLDTMEDWNYLESLISKG